MKKNAQIIIFDDTCIFCIKAVNFIIKRDKNKVFYFAGFNSKSAKELIKKYGQEEQGNKSILLIKKDKAYNKSRALSQIALSLPFLWPSLIVIDIFPLFLMDALYMWVSNNRHRFLKKDKSSKINSSSNLLS